MIMSWTNPLLTLALFLFFLAVGYHGVKPVPLILCANIVALVGMHQYKVRVYM